jgi:hypothetical protein
MPARTQNTAALAPHSWDFEHWPSHVYPHSENRARWLLRSKRAELLAAGAVVRVGREFVFIGAKFTRWLQMNACAVPNFKPPGLGPLNDRRRALAGQKEAA